MTEIALYNIFFVPIGFIEGSYLPGCKTNFSFIKGQNHNWPRDDTMIGLFLPCDEDNTSTEEDLRFYVVMHLVIGNVSNAFYLIFKFSQSIKLQIIISV